MILACDVGGTKTDLALLAFDGPAAQVLRRATYASREHASLAEIVADFVGPRPPVLEAAGFGVAGPV
ncbi:MAG: glucokinase, partial [Trueperaceae bacterium]|nr:glucokinase [Trueperaceae bacterium]